MRKNLRAIIAIEFENMAYFPILEGIVCLLVFFCVGTLLGGFMESVFIVPRSVYNGTGIEANILEAIRKDNTQAAAGPLISLPYVLSLIAPLLSTLSLTRPIEDGTLRTYLSFPVSRSTILFVKFLLVNLLLWGISMGGWIIQIVLGIPNFQQYPTLLFWSLVLLLNCMLITSTCFLVSMLSKRTETSLLFGLGMWYLLTMMSTNYNLSIQVRGVFYPVVMIWASIYYGTSYVSANQFILPIIGTIVLIALAYSACHLIFQGMEV